jgi:chromosomal replication initiation ATPase DnaA
MLRQVGMERTEGTNWGQIRVDREHPSYERPSVDQVLKTLAKRYWLKVEDLRKNKQGKNYEPRKVCMYLANELCDMKLKEIAAQFGTGSYGTVGWACHGVASPMQSDAKFRKRVSSIRRICQQFDPVGL